MYQSRKSKYNSSARDIESQNASESKFNWEHQVTRYEYLQLINKPSIHYYSMKHSSSGKGSASNHPAPQHPFFFDARNAKPTTATKPNTVLSVDIALSHIPPGFAPTTYFLQNATNVGNNTVHFPPNTKTVLFQLQKHPSAQYHSVSLNSNNNQLIPQSYIKVALTVQNL